MDAQPRIGQIVNVRVKRVITGGLLVEISGHDAAGVIRLREIGSLYGAALDAWKEQFRPGDRLRALVIRCRDDGRLELSLKQVERDPWQGISQHLQPGQLVDGVVTNVESYGAFVELPSGVTGLLHVSRLPVGVGVSLADLLWPADRVKAIVEAVDESERRIRLSLQGLSDQRWAYAQGPERRPSPPPGKRADASSRVAEAPKLPIELLTEQPPHHFLVVEDDPDQRKALTDWLRRAGQDVYPVGSGEEALETGVALRPDIALVDLGLPGINGAETIRRLLALQPELRAVMMTDWSRAEEHENDVRALEERGVELLLKPLLPVELLDVLCKTPPTTAAPATRDLPDRSLAPSSLPAGDSSHDTRALQATLTSVLNRTNAAQAIVFSLDPVERRIEILANRGRLQVNGQALAGLIRSPVRDVAEQEHPIRTDDAQHADEARFRYLLPLLPFASCIGAPIRANLSTRPALFLFHTRQGAFAKSDEEAVEAAAQMLAMILERQSFLQKASELQRMAMLGQLSRALIHEVNHRLSPVSFALDTLQRQSADLDRSLARTTNELDLATLGREFHDTRQSLDYLAQAVRALIQTAKLFGKMTKVEHEAGIALLSELATEVAELTQDLAHKHRVKIQVEPPDKLTCTRTQTALVRQVLLNIVLNAVQQIALLRPKDGGQVRISFDDRSSTEERVVCINIEDDGPGIHRRLWEHIFQLGYTTRPEGTGLGLHISRSLIEALGGRVYVLDSRIHWGSNFCIELPFKP